MADGIVGAVAWSDTPPDTDDKFYPIVRASIYRPVYGLVISKQVCGADLHWHQGHNYPCRGSKELCEGCRLESRLRWYGYLAILDGNSGKVGLLELTGNAIKECPRLLSKLEVKRGMRLKVFRRGKWTTAPLVVQVLSHIDPDSVPCPDFDLRPHLLKIWGHLPARGKRNESFPVPTFEGEGGGL